MTARAGLGYTAGVAAADLLGGLELHLRAQLVPAICSMRQPCAQTSIGQQAMRGRVGWRPCESISAPHTVFSCYEPMQVALGSRLLARCGISATACDARFAKAAKGN